MTDELPRVYATVEDLERRLGKQVDSESEWERAQALLEDASAIIRAVAGGDWDDPPDVVQTVCLNMVTRAWLNPEGVRQQSLGSFSMTFSDVETGVAITAEERRLVRIAAGYGVGLDSIQLTTGNDTTSTVFAPAGDGTGDWMPWLAT